MCVVIGSCHLWASIYIFCLLATAGSRGDAYQGAEVDEDAHEVGPVFPHTDIPAARFQGRA